MQMFLCRIVTQKVTLDGVRVRAPRFPSSLLEQTKHSHFIECDHARARRFHDLHGIKSSPNFLSDAAVLMKRAKHVLDSLKVPFWLSSGTCLGECTRSKQQHNIRKLVENDAN